MNTVQRQQSARSCLLVCHNSFFACLIFKTGCPELDANDEQDVTPEVNSKKVNRTSLYYSVQHVSVIVF